jgi:hypothetical protein
MDDLKKTSRDVEESTKENWRKADGEDLADKVGNADDDVRKEVDEARRKADTSARDAERPY